MLKFSMANETKQLLDQGLVYTRHGMLGKSADMLVALLFPISICGHHENGKIWIWGFLRPCL